MAQIPTPVKGAIEGILDNIIGDTCKKATHRVEHGGYTWKVSVSEGVNKDIDIRIRRMKRGNKS